MSALEPVQLERLREIGNLLKQERETKGMALDDVSAKTLIRPGILKAIEEADARPLPEPVYLKGFIRRYADLLGLSGTQLADSFPWQPSEAVPSTFVAAAVTTADSVDEPRRPFSAPRNEARVVEPDPVLPDETENAEAPEAEVAKAQITEAKDPGLQASEANTTEPIAASPDAFQAESPESEAQANVPSASDIQETVAKEASLQQTLDETAPAAQAAFTAAEASGVSPAPEVEASLNAGAEEPPMPTLAKAAVGTQGAEAPRSEESQGLPLPIVGAILAGIGFLAAIAFAIGNRAPQTAKETTPATTTEQVSSANSEATEPPASTAGSEASSSESVSAPATSETPAAEKPAETAKPAETTKPVETTKPAETTTETPKPAAGEVALGVEVKDEPAWFFVEVDGRVVYEGIASDFKESFTGKEVVLGSSRPDLIQVSVNGKKATAFGTTEEKTQSFTATQ